MTPERWAEIQRVLKLPDFAYVPGEDIHDIARELAGEVERLRAELAAVVKSAKPNVR